MSWRNHDKNTAGPLNKARPDMVTAINPFRAFSKRRTHEKAIHTIHTSSHQWELGRVGSHKPESSPSCATHCAVTYPKN